jgi:DNA-directed RNA polymerase II subunit RPB2
MERVIHAYLRHPDGSLWAHQTQSYEQFMKEGLAQIIHYRSTIVASSSSRSIEIKFGRVTILDPCVREQDGQTRKLTPLEARTRKMTYQVGVTVDVHQKITTADGNVVSEHTFREVPILKMPCMVNSCFCTDYENPQRDSISGYFIINGNEKTCQSQIKLRVNCPFLHKHATNGYYCEVRSCNEELWRSTISLRLLVRAPTNKCGMCVTVPAFTDEVPLVVLLGILARDCVSSKEELYNLCDQHISRWTRRKTKDAAQHAVVAARINAMLHDHRIEGIIATENLSFGETVLNHAANELIKERTPERRMQVAVRALCIDLLPHLGTLDDAPTRARKFTFVCMMAAQALIAFCSPRGLPVAADDRDHWRHKRIDTSGALIAMLFRQLWRNNIRSFEMHLKKAIDGNGNIRSIDFLNFRKLEVGVKYHFSTGVWSVMRGVDPSACSGVCQAITRMSRVAAISSLRRINCPVNRNGKTSMPRMLHRSDFGHVCATETPEGSACGLILNLPLVAHCRLGSSTKNILRLIQIDSLLGPVDDPVIDCGSQPLETETLTVFASGFITGTLPGKRASDVRELLREARHNDILPRDCSIVADELSNTIFINCDIGAILRPIFRIDRVHRVTDLLRSSDAVLEWEDIWQLGVIEFIDQEESDEHCVIATSLDDVRSGHTHVEILASATLLGVAASLIPFCDHNQSPRNIYQAAMGKQAVCCDNGGVGVQKFDAHKYTLWYGQRSLSETKMSKILGSLSYIPEPSTTEMCVMIAAWSGYNQEDAIIVKKEAIERGAGVITTFRVYSDELNSKGNDDEMFCKVDGAAGMKRADYSKLQSDGCPAIGTHLDAGDVIIGKTSQTVQLGPDGRHVPLKFCRSTIVREPCVIDSVYWTCNKDGKRQVKVRVRTVRRPGIGDKFASRCAQKGTIGYVVPTEDLPFNRDGISPDVIINPHAFISRMTIGMFIESLAGKAAALDGKFVDASPFTPKDVVGHAETVLRKHGFMTSGEEIFYDGRTGKQMRSSMFMGICSYQRLKHLVSEKRHSRTKGSYHILTGQPLEGRGKNGGLRIGEMEKDCFISYGASAVISDRMLDQSDCTTMTICNRCGLPAEQTHSDQFARGKRGRHAFCRNCDDGAHCVELRTPCANKLFQQELMSMNTAIKVTAAAVQNMTIEPPAP